MVNDSTEKISILAKIELLNDLFQNSRKRIKELKIELDICAKNKHSFGWFEDCGEFYNSEHKITEIRLECAVDERIRIEKTLRFFKHRLREL